MEMVNFGWEAGGRKGGEGEAGSVQQTDGRNILSVSTWLGGQGWPGVARGGTLYTRLANWLWEEQGGDNQTHWDEYHRSGEICLT